MKKFGFVRVGAYVNKLALANPLENAKEIIKGIKDASKKGVAIISTPELALTGYSCGDLFLQDKLINGAEDALKVILKDTGKTEIVPPVTMISENNTNNGYLLIMILGVLGFSLSLKRRFN